jgi:hypothetical protein
MTQSLRWLPALVAFALPFAASAQLGDAAYCDALIRDYFRFVIKVGSHPNTGSLDGNVAVEQCRAGNFAAGIPVLERKLREAGVELPARG